MGYRNWRACMNGSWWRASPQYMDDNAMRNTDTLDLSTSNSCVTYTRQQSFQNQRIPTFSPGIPTTKRFCKPTALITQ